MPVGFQVGPLFIRFYGIILMLGAVAAAFVAEREVRNLFQSSSVRSLLSEQPGPPRVGQVWKRLAVAPARAA